MRKIKGRRKYHLFTGTEDEKKIIFVGDGRDSYLWIGYTNNDCFAIYRGAAPLKALAKSILKELGE